MTTWRSGAALFGKAPWHDEFLRPPAAAGDLRTVDEWLFQATSALGSAPPERREQGPHGFLLQLDASIPLRAVAGVLGPSHDSSGRAYPLALAASVHFESGVADHVQLLPVLIESFWQRAEIAWTAARTSRLAPDDDLLRTATEMPVESVESARELYAGWIEGTTVADLSEQLAQPIEWVAAAASTVAKMASRPLEVRAPLGRAGGSALCFWIDLLWRCDRQGATLPSFFWSHDGDAGDAVLCLGAPTAAALRALWQTSAPEGGVFDLTGGPSLIPAPSPDPRESLLSFLGRVGAR
jgi:type VI secretion system ImpM family protein